MKYSDIWIATSKNPTPPRNTIFFAQVACEAPSDYLEEKSYWGLFNAVIGLFMCVFFRFTITHLQNRQKIDDKLLDIDLISIEDYSVRGKISKDLYEHVMKKTENKDLDVLSDDARRNYVPIRRFKDYLTENIQKNLQERDHTLSKKDTQVADIVFAFDNSVMLRLLKKRYEYLCKAKFDKAEAIEERMTTLKNDKYEQIIVPNTFFCTFMEGEGQY